MSVFLFSYWTNWTFDKFIGQSPINLSKVQIDTIQSIFNTINAATIVYYTARVFCALQEKFHITHVLFDSSLPNLILKSLPATLGTGGLIALSIAIWKKSNPIFKPEKQVTRRQGQERFLELSFGEKLSYQQQFGRLCHISKIILNTALTCLTTSPFVCAITLATSGYSLLKNMNLKWRYFSREMSTTQMPIPSMTSVEAHYRFLIFPHATPTTPEACPICLEDIENDIRRTPFCQNHHIVHVDCITDYITPKFNTSIFERFSFTKSWNRYTATILKEDLPICPSCRDVPSLDIKVQEGCKTYNVSVRMTGLPELSPPPINKQTLYANLYTVYNVVQAGLSYLQKYPELAATLFKLQQVMMVSDVIGYAYTTHSLYKRIEAKLRMENSVAFKVAALATAVAVAALSYYVTLHINTYLQSAIVLKDLLAKLPIAPEILNNIDISWNSPLSHRLIQSLYINRIVSTVALAFFSTQRKAHLLSAAAQVAGLMGISRLRWIEMAQLDHSNQNTKLITHFLVDPSCTLEPGHLQSTIQSIYQCVNTLLNKVTWNSYWLVERRNGFEVNRSLICDVTFPSIPTDACGCGLSPSLMNLAVIPVKYISRTFNVFQKNPSSLGNFVRWCLNW